MSFTRTGFILYVHPYAACVAFYRDVLGLPVLFGTPGLTCFAFGDGYLMVEQADDGPPPEAGVPYRTCLRMNVPDVRARADALAARGVGVDYQEHDWGTVAKFEDPAGNLCAFKDDEKFERQVGSVALPASTWRVLG
jgi:lactoylglutathione lyase